MTATPVFGHRSAAVAADVREIDGRPVSWFSLDGGKHRGAIGSAEGQAMERAVRLAVELGIPVIGRVASSGADVGEGIAALHAWGRVARAMVDASVPPTANLEQIGEEIQLDIVSGSPRAVSAAPALSNSFGFGGHNATLIFAPAS